MGRDAEVHTEPIMVRYIEARYASDAAYSRHLATIQRSGRASFKAHGTLHEWLDAVHTEQDAWSAWRKRYFPYAAEPQDD